MVPSGECPNGQEMVKCWRPCTYHTFAPAPLVQLNDIAAVDGPFSRGLAAIHLAIAARHAAIACMPACALWEVAGIVDLDVAKSRTCDPWPTGKEAGYGPLAKRHLTQQYEVQFGKCKGHAAWRALPAFTTALQAAGGGKCSAQMLKC